MPLQNNSWQEWNSAIQAALISCHLHLNVKSWKKESQLEVAHQPLYGLVTNISLSLCEHRADTLVLLTNKFKKKNIIVICVLCALLRCQPLSFPLRGNCHPESCIYYFFVFLYSPTTYLISLNSIVFRYAFLKLCINGCRYFATLLLLLNSILLIFIPFSAQLEFIHFFTVL